MRRDRREFILLGALSATALAWSINRVSLTAADELVPLEVAYAGSMGSMMDGPIRTAARSLGIELRGRAQGSMGLAHLIEGGSIRPDVFISVTPPPMRVVLKAGKATSAAAIARTEMVIAYSPKSRFAPRFADSQKRGESWWKILESSGFRFGRTDPTTDPQGLNILFAMKLASKLYNQPDLEQRVLGPQINPEQIFQEPEVMARLQAGQLDASSAYKAQPGAMRLPFIQLPPEINLGDASREADYAKVSVDLNGKTLRPSPLVFYAATLNDAAHPELANKFVNWLRGPEAQKILTENSYDSPAGASDLRA